MTKWANRDAEIERALTIAAELRADAYVAWHEHRRKLAFALNRRARRFESLARRLSFIPNRPWGRTPGSLTGEAAE